MSITIVKKHNYSQFTLYIRKKKTKQFSQTKENLKLITLLKVKKILKFFKIPIFLTDISASELCNTLYCSEGKQTIAPASDNDIAETGTRESQSQERRV